MNIRERLSCGIHQHSVSYGTYKSNIVIVYSLSINSVIVSINFPVSYWSINPPITDLLVVAIALHHQRKSNTNSKWLTGICCQNENCLFPKERT